MKTHRRQQQHDHSREQIKAIAWKQITENGASALSLGAIARELGVTPPALYRYFPSRDDLVTALIQEAYASFVAALESARDALPEADPAGRLRSLCLAYRGWAIDHPQQYILIFGTPIPGYRLDPAAGLAADHSFLVLLDVFATAEAAGRIVPSAGFEELPPGLEAQLEAAVRRTRPYSARVLYLALAGWSFIHGMTSLELDQHSSLILESQADAFFRLEVERFIRSIGLA